MTIFITSQHETEDETCWDRGDSLFYRFKVYNNTNGQVTAQFYRWGDVRLMLSHFYSYKAPKDKSQNSKPIPPDSKSGFSPH